MYDYVWKLDTRHNYAISLFLDPLSVPRFTVNTATSTGVEYRVERSDTATIRVITGYEVFRFGVPMIGEYVNALTGRRVTINPAVPGAQYRITAWALDSGTRRSATPAVKSASTRAASEPQTLHQGVQLNSSVIPAVGYFRIAWTYIQICYTEPLHKDVHIFCDDN